jgi:hypothetical protein
MDFLPVATPQNESELAVMVSMLEAHGIQHYVHNQGFGGLYPGMQINLYNDRRIMVAIDQVAEACELLSVFLQRPELDPAIEEKMTLKDKLRVVLETCMFGWSFPSKRRTIKDDFEI